MLTSLRQSINVILFNYCPQTSEYLKGFCNENQRMANIHVVNIRNDITFFEKLEMNVVFSTFTKRLKGSDIYSDHLCGLKLKSRKFSFLSADSL